MPERDAVLCELILKMLAVDAGLDPRCERESVDLKHAVHAAHVEADNHPVVSILRLKAAGDVGAAPKRDKHYAVLVGGTHYLRDVLFVVREHYAIGCELNLPVAE